MAYGIKMEKQGYRRSGHSLYDRFGRRGEWVEIWKRVNSEEICLCV